MHEEYDGEPDEKATDPCRYCGSYEAPRMEESGECAWWTCVDCDEVVDSYEPEIEHEECLPS